MTVASPARSSTIRRMAGVLLALASLLALAVLIGSFLNTRRYVVLLTYAANPFGVAFTAFATGAAAIWLLLPVRDEARQGARNVVRWTALVIAVLSALAFGLTIGMTAFVYKGEVLAHAPRDRYDLALVDRGGENTRQLRVWRGHGLATRDMGSFGDTCGDQVEVHFTGPTEFDVSTVYGTFHLRVGPTGRPANSIGPTCSG